MRMPCDHVSGTVESEATCRERDRPWILAATILASSMAFIDSTVVNVALPAMQASFHANVVDVQWVVEAYGLFLGALILLGGSLGDVFGRRRIFLSGVALFAAASVGCGVAPSIHVLNFARSLQGMGAALLVPGSLAIISSSFDETSRGQAIGTWSGVSAMTTAIGPVLGGWLVQHASWRWVFFINVPLAAAVMAISVWRIPESRSSAASRVDWVGAMLATLALSGIVFGLIESINLGWRSPLVAASLTVGIGCLGGFAIFEGRTRYPMVPLALFRNSSFSGANLLTLFLYAAVGIFFFLFPLNLIQVQGYSSTEAGAAILPFILLMFFLSRWSGGLVARYGPRGPLMAGPLIVALGFGLFVVPSIAHSYWTTFFPAAIVLGFGMAVTVAPLTTSVMNSVGEDRVGTASGINNAVARVAGVLAIAVFGLVMVYGFRTRLEHALSTASLAPEALRAVRAQETRLAGLQLPAGLDRGTTAAIKDSIAHAFVFGFRIVMGVCTGLAIAGAAVAWLMIPAQGEREVS